MLLAPLMTAVAIFFFARTARDPMMPGAWDQAHHDRNHREQIAGRALAIAGKLPAHAKYREIENSSAGGGERADALRHGRVARQDQDRIYKLLLKMEQARAHTACKHRFIPRQPVPPPVGAPGHNRIPAHSMRRAQRTRPGHAPATETSTKRCSRTTAAHADERRGSSAATASPSAVAASPSASALPATTRADTSNEY